MPSEFPQVTPDQLLEQLRKHIKADKPLCVLAEPGVGKSRIVEQAIVEAIGEGHGPNGSNYHPFIGSTRQPTDLMGMPAPDVANKQMVWLPPGPDDLPTENPGAIFADELPSAPVLTQSALLQLFGKERRAGSYRCPEGVIRVAAGNRPQDKTGAGKVITALGNRMSVFELVVSPKEWLKWARQNGIDDRIIGYIGFTEKSKKPALLDWDSNRTINATPRAWEDVSDLLKVIDDPSSQVLMMGGRVGQGQAADAMSFFKYFGRIMNPDDVLKNPDKCEVYKINSGDGIGMTFALMSALAGRTDAKTAGAILRYAQRLSPEFGFCLVEDAKAVNLEAVTSNKEHQSWVTAHPELYK